MPAHLMAVTRVALVVQCRCGSPPNTHSAILIVLIKEHPAGLSSWYFICRNYTHNSLPPRPIQISRAGAVVSGSRFTDNYADFGAGAIRLFRAAPRNWGCTLYSTPPSGTDLDAGQVPYIACGKVCHAMHGSQLAVVCWGIPSVWAIIYILGVHNRVPAFTACQSSNTAALCLSAILQAIYIVNSSFEGNSAGIQGGAVHSDGSALITRNVTFKRNSCRLGGGGAVFMARCQGAINFYEGLFEANTALGTGGAIYTQGCCTTLNATQLLGNRAASGGAVAADVILGDLKAGKYVLELNGCQVQGNTANGTTGTGGALRATSVQATIRAGEWVNNSAASDGGAVAASGEGSLVIRGVKLMQQNTALLGRGGAVSPCMSVYTRMQLMWGEGRSPEGRSGFIAWPQGSGNPRNLRRSAQ